MSERPDPPPPPDKLDWSAVLAAAERRGVRVWRYDQKRGHPVPVEDVEDVEEIR